ncbi:MAG: hypothetical protein IPM32_17395 [Ignavibacteriae bacterium]|nr:hypothetical protein [Ignavibacteriota bacterium]
MKKTLFLTAILFGLFLTNLNAYDYHRNIRVEYFFNSLEPYGEWIDIGFDDYVWRPYNTYRDWRPYTDGRWEWTHNGWYWVSYEPFGWATYHYGRWFFDDYYGWVWMPDSEWGPAWVEWRYDDYYIGWAPLPPYARFYPKHGIRFSIRWNSGHFYWNFVKYNHFVSVDIHKHYIFGNNAERIYRRTKHRTNYYSDNDRIVNGGVNREFVEKRIGKRISARDINFSEKKYDSRELRNKSEIREFRPNEIDVNRENSFDRSKVTKGRELKNLRSDKVVITRKTEIKNSDEKSFEKNIERKVENRDVKKDVEISRNVNKNYDEKIVNRKYDKEISKSESKSRVVVKRESSKSIEKSTQNNPERNTVKKESRVEVKRETEKSRSFTKNNDKEEEKRTVKSRK